MKLYEAKFDDFNISDITQKAINKKGIGQVNLINVKLDEKEKWCELLFEVESSTGNPIHTDMKGRFRTGLKFGYSCILRFTKLSDQQMEELKQGKGIQQIIDKNDVILHCDDPSFYWQGNHEEDSRKHNARYQFQGKKGSGEWSLRHQAGGRKDGLALCKHLFGVRHWLEDSGNVASVNLKFRELNLPLKSDQDEENREEEEKKDDQVVRQNVNDPKGDGKNAAERRRDKRSGSAWNPETHSFEESVLYKLYKFLRD